MWTPSFMAASISSTGVRRSRTSSAMPVSTTRAIGARACLQYVNEFLTQFSAEDDQPLLGNCLRAQAEALWSLGERAGAEEQYETLIGAPKSVKLDAGAGESSS